MPFTAKASIPRLEKEAERSILEQFRAIAAAIRELEQPGEVVTALKFADYVAHIGELVRVVPPAAGMRVLLPEGSEQNDGESVRIAIESVASGGTVTVAVAGSTQRINGLPTLTLANVGLVEVVSLGKSGWAAIASSPTPTWAQVLAEGATTGAFNPIIATGQFLQIGNGAPVTVGAIRGAATYQIASDVDLTFASGAALGFASGTSMTIVATTNMNATALGSVTFTGVTGATIQSSTGNVNLNSVSTGFVAINSFLRMIEKAASTPSLSATQFLIWALNLAPNVPMCTDDRNIDHRLAYLNVATGNGAQTNSTTNISCGVLTQDISPTVALTGDILVGHTYHARCNYVFAHTIAPPTLTFEVLINGVVVEAVVVAFALAVGVQGGCMEADIQILTIGAGGTANVHMHGYTSGGLALADQIAASVAVAADAIDTTIVQTLELRVRMTTAVAANTLTVMAGSMQRIN